MSNVKEQNACMASVTPCEIGVAIHYHYVASPHPQINAVSIRAAIEKFERCGILEKDDDRDGGGYKTTERGKAWIELLCKVKFPKLLWVEDKD